MSYTFEYLNSYLGTSQKVTLFKDVGYYLKETHKDFSFSAVNKW